MKSARNFRAMLIVGGGLTAAIGTPGAAVASCGAFSPREESPSAFKYESPETTEQRAARLAEHKAKREARRAANLAKKAAKQQAAAEKAAAVQSTAVARN